MNTASEIKFSAANENIQIRKIGDVTLINGDCRDVLPQIRARGFVPNLLVTDPPYKLSSGGKTGLARGGVSGKFGRENYSNDGNISGEYVDPNEWLPLAYKCLSYQSDAYVMHNHAGTLATHEAALKAGFRHHNLLVWNRGNKTPNRWYMHSAEFIHYVFKGRAQSIRNPGTPSILGASVSPVTDHPCEKPVSLMRCMIENSSDPGELVIDPFMGSGATIVAALQSGRRVIGIELEAKWFDIAVARVEKYLNNHQIEFDLAGQVQ